MVKCNETLAAFEGVVGWGDEQTCGVPKNSTQLPTLANFGVVTDFSPDGWWSDRTKRRGIGSQGITQNRRTSVIGGFSVEYAAVDSLLQARLEKAFGAAGALADHLDTFFVEAALNRASATVQQQRFLYNMAKVVDMEIVLSVDEPIMVTENCIAQYVRKHTAKAYPAVTDETLATILAAVTIGADPADISEEMLMYYEGDPILVEDPLGTPVDVPLAGVQDMTFSLARNTEQRRGIRRGLVGRMAYEMAERIRDISLTITKDFHDVEEYDRMVAEEGFDFKFDVGTTRITLVGGKWEGTPPAMAEEDLVSESLTASFDSATYATIP
jgi:hypothetical protein